MVKAEFNKLEDYQDAVGGLIEAVEFNIGNEASGDHYLTMYLNEEGKIFGLPTNDVATQFTTLFEGYYIAGDVVIIGLPDEEGNTKNLTVDEIARVKTGLRMAKS